MLCSKACCAEAEEEAERVLYRGERCYVLLNAYPYNSGHLMVAPRAHVADLADLDPETCAEMMCLAQLCVRALKRCLGPHGFNIGLNLGKAAGAGIDEHLHLHVVPRWSGDTNFMSALADTRVVPQSLDDTARMIRPLIQEEAAKR